MSRENVKRGDYILGIDLGSNSVGFAAISAHDPASPVPVEELEVFQIGSHVFEEAGADNVSKGVRELNNHVRQKARRARITYRRWKWRKERLYEIFTELGVLPEDPFERDRILCIHKDEGLEKDPLTLRVRGLDEELDPVDFAKALCHLNRRRGYLSTRDLQTREIPQGMLEEARRAYLDVPDTSEDDVPAKTEGDDEDKRVVLGGIQRARKALVKNEARTFGELLHKAHAQGSYTRHYTKRFNKKLKEQVKLAPEEKHLNFRADRAMIEAEFDLLWERQSKARPELWTPARRDEIHQIIFYQYELGPSDHLRKACMFYPSKKCAPRASRAFQEFRIVQDLVSYIFVGEKKKKKGEAGERTVLPEETLRAMLAVLASGYDIAVDEKDRDLPNVRGCLADYIKVPHDLVKRSKFHKYRIIHGSPTIRLMRQGSKGQWDAWSEEVREHVLDVLTSAQTPSGAYKALVKRGIEPQIAANLAMAPLPEGYGEYSTKALKKMTGLMMELGLQQKVVLDKMDEERRAALSMFPQEKIESSDPEEIAEAGRLRPSDVPSLRNPIVEKALRRTIWVLNQVVHRYGTPSLIRVELPRDLTLSAEAKAEIEKEQRENEAEKKRLAEELRQAGLEPTAKNIEKMRLMREQGGMLLYEPEGGTISPSQFEDLEVDHVVPRSRFWVDRMFNKVLCTRKFNAEKGDMLPYEYFMSEAGGGEPAWLQYQARVKKLQAPKFKKAWLIRTDDPTDFLESQMHATGFLAREMVKLLARTGAKIEVTPGRATGMLRRMWDLEADLFPDWLGFAKASKAKDEEQKPTKGKGRSDHRHHSVDALVVALTNPKVLKAVQDVFLTGQGERLRADFQKDRLRKERARLLASTCPISGLRPWLKENADSIPVSCYSREKVTGALNEATAIAPRNAGLSDADLQGEPRSCRIVGNKMVRYDGRGRASQVYKLGNNHHLQVYVGPKPGKRGEPDLDARIVSTLEVAYRVEMGHPVYQEDAELLARGYRLALTLEKGEVVEFKDKPGQHYKVAAISFAGATDVRFQLISNATMDQALYNQEVAGKVPVLRYSSLQKLTSVESFVTLNAFGVVVTKRAAWS